MTKPKSQKLEDIKMIASAEWVTNKDDGDKVVAHQAKTILALCEVIDAIVENYSEVIDVYVENTNRIDWKTWNMDQLYEEVESVLEEKLK